MDWNIKTEQDGGPVIDGTKITFINPEGEELQLDPPAMYGKILELNKESQKHREANKALTEKFAIFKDIEDIGQWHTDAKAAMETVANFNDKDWVKAEKVEAFKAEINTAWEAKMTQKDAQIQEIQTAHSNTLAQKDARIRKLMVSSKFSQSPWFVGENKKTTMRPDMAEALWGDRFQVEEEGEHDLKIVAYYDRAGKEPIHSKANPGDPAPFEEAIGLLIDRYDGKSEILVSSDGGSGSGGGQGGGNAGDEISNLQRQIKAAQEAGNAKEMIVLKNRLFELQKAKK